MTVNQDGRANPNNRITLKMWNSIKSLSGIFVFVFLFLLAFTAYWPILNSYLWHDDFMNFDFVSGLSTSELWRICVIPDVFWRPLGFLVLWIISQVWGISVIPAHTLNVGLYAGSGFLLFWLMTRLGITRLTAFLAATVFILSPMSTEAVAWISAIFDQLALFFILLALCLYLVFIQNKNRIAYAGSMIACAFAFLSKENSMILVILIPLLEILYVKPRQQSEVSPWRRLNNRLRQSGARLSVLFAIFTCYFTLRFYLIGGLGGYPGETFFGLPRITTAARTFMAMLAPFDRIMFSKSFTYIFVAYVGLLGLFSLALVLLRWKQTSESLHKAWIFLMAFFACSFIPAWFGFIKGIDFYLYESRFFYMTTFLMIILVVIGLLEFGRKYSRLQAATLIAVLLLIPCYFWGVRQNNVPRDQVASMGVHLTEQTYELVPDPPYRTKFYFQNLPQRLGSHWYGSDLAVAIMWKYNKPIRSDFFSNPENREIQVYYVDPGEYFKNWFEFLSDDSSDGYLFVYNQDDESLDLVHGPPTQVYSANIEAVSD